MRTETAKRVVISELGPVIRRHRRTVATGGKPIGLVGGPSIIPSVVPSVSSIASASSAGVVLGFDHREVNGHDHGNGNHQDSSGDNKPEKGPLEQRSTTCWLNFDPIRFKTLFEMLLAFGDQRGGRRSERLSRRCRERGEIR